MAGTAAAQTAPVVTVTNPVISERSNFAGFFVRLDRRSSQIVTVTYDTISGSASYFDFADLSTSTLSFAPGETGKSVRVGLDDDFTQEGGETFYLRLRAATNGTIGTGTAAATIIDNDAAVGVPAISVIDATVDEAAGGASFVLVLSRPSTRNVSVSYRTQAGTANAADFTPRSGTLTIAAGLMTAFVTIPVANDVRAEPTEAFDLVLSRPVNATLAEVRGTARIWASDQGVVSLPTVSAGNTTANEASGFAEFLVRLSRPSTRVVTVVYDTISGSASYFDFADLSTHTLSFAPGEVLRSVRVGLDDDLTDEGGETFYLRLHQPTNGVIGTGTAAGTILDDDS